MSQEKDKKNRKDLIYEEDFENIFDSLVKEGRIDVYLTEYNLELFYMLIFE